MPDNSTPEDPEKDGEVDYSQRDYQAPSGYRAPDFVSKWAAQDSRGDEQRLEDKRREAERDAEDAAEDPYAAPQGHTQSFDTPPGLPDPPRTLEELDEAIRRDAASQTPGFVVQGGGSGEELTQSADGQLDRQELLQRVATDSSALLGNRARDVQRAASAGGSGSIAKRLGDLASAPPSQIPGAKATASASTVGAGATGTARKKGGGAWFGLIAAILALTLAISGISFIAWALIVFALISSIGLLRAGGGRRAVGVITLLLTVIALVIQLIGSTGGSIRGAVTELSGGTATLDLDGTASVSGTGNARFDVVLPDGADDIGLLQVEFEGEQLRIYDVDAEGEQMGGLLDQRLLRLLGHRGHQRMDGRRVPGHRHRSGGGVDRDTRLRRHASLVRRRVLGGGPGGTPVRRCRGRRDLHVRARPERHDRHVRRRQLVREHQRGDVAHAAVRVRSDDHPHRAVRGGDRLEHQLRRCSAVPDADGLTR